MARIALAEDNEHLRKLLTTLLGLKGHEVVAFDNGQDALDAVLSASPAFELVLSDVNMPRLDGLELCRGLRERFSKDQLPVILLSVLGSEDDILNGFDAGASDYLVKPFSTKVVQAKIGLYLQRRAGSSTRAGGPRPEPLLEDPRAFPAAYDKYELLERLGDGSYGIVYRARRLVDGLPIALKLLSREVSEDREKLARYFREIAVLSALDHPNVVRCVDSGFERARYFLAMELVEGESALAQLRRTGPLPSSRVARVGADLTSALARLVREDLIHRDIKPANVILRRDGSAVLIDFGLAKGRREDGLTQADEFLGTAEYIAPEVISGERESVRSDMFSLGVTLYELATDVAPFHARTTYDVLMRIASGEPATPAAVVRPGVSPQLSALIAALMDPNPDRRLSDPELASRRLAGLAVSS